MPRKNGKSETNTAPSKVKVLYQNLNGVWYAFANVGDSVFFGKVPVQSKAPERAPQQSVAPARKRAPSKAA